MKFDVEIAGADAEPLLRDTAGFDRLQGTLSGKFSGKTRGQSQRHMVANLNGRGNFAFVDGAIRGFNLAAMARTISPAALGRSFDRSQKTDFAELSGSFRINKGVLRNNDLKLSAPLLRATGKGNVHLPRRTVNYRTEAKAVASLEGQGGRAGLLGIVVPVIFKGPWDDLSIRPDLAGLLKPGGGELIEGAKGIVGGGAGGIKDLLKGLGGTEAAPARKPKQPGAKSQPLIDPTKLLKKLFD